MTSVYLNRIDQLNAAFCLDLFTYGIPYIFTPDFKPDNMEIQKIDALKLAAATGAALFTGGGLYVNIVEIPAIFTIRDTETLRRVWAEAFNRAKLLQSGSGTLAMITGGLAYYYDDSDFRMLWAVGAGAISTIWPWTMLVMIPDIKKLLKDDVIEQRGEKWVKDNIGTWNRRQMFRSFVGAVAFGSFLYGLYKSK